MLVFIFKAYSLLEYNCGTIPDNAHRVVLGTVTIGSK